MPTQQANADNNTEPTAEPSLRELLDLQTRNRAKEEDECVTVPFEDARTGAEHLAWKLIQDDRNHVWITFLSTTNRFFS